MLYDYFSKSVLNLNCDLTQYSNQKSLTRFNSINDIDILVQISDKKFERIHSDPDNLVDDEFLKCASSILIVLPDNNSSEIKMRHGSTTDFTPDFVQNNLENLSKLINLKSLYSVFNKKFKNKNKTKKELAKLNYFLNSDKFNNDAFVT